MLNWLFGVKPEPKRLTWEEEQEEKKRKWAVPDGYCAGCQYWFCVKGYSTGTCVAGMHPWPQPDCGCGTWKRCSLDRFDWRSKEAQIRGRERLWKLAIGRQCRWRNSFYGSLREGTVDHICVSDTRLTIALKGQDGCINLYSDTIGSAIWPHLGPSRVRYIFWFDKEKNAPPTPHYPNGLYFGEFYFDVTPEEIGWHIEFPETGRCGEPL